VIPRARPLPLHPSFAWRLAVFYAALFVALGVQLPFLPLWLAAKGLDAGAIGIALAVPMIVRVFAIPLATRGADRHDALRMAIVIAAAMAVLGYGLVGMAQGAAVITLALALASVFYTPIMPLADAYALRGLGRLGRAYGPVRLWGSAAFIVGSLGAGLLLDLIAAHELIWLIVAALTITAAAAYALAPLPPHEGNPSATHLSSGLLRDPAFLAAAAAASLIQASHAVYYGFSALDWRAAGLDGGAIGALWALAVVAEIALFAISPRLPLVPTTLLMLGAAGAVVRWSAMAFDPPTALLPPLQCLHALSFGATHLGALGFMARAAPAELGATAQGYLAVALGLVMAAAMGISGLLYARWGGLAYGAMALAAAAGGVFALAAHRLTDGTRLKTKSGSTWP
jgi:MFS transporter, PPP family, 3-phenylpropionic acid transporter